MKFAWTLTVGGLLLSAAVVNAQQIPGGSSRVLQPPTPRPTMYRTTPANPAAAPAARLTSIPSGPQRGGVRTASAPVYSGPIGDGAYATPTPTPAPAAAPAGPAPGWAHNTGIPSYPPGAGYSGAVGDASYDGGYVGDGSGNCGCGSGCGGNCGGCCLRNCCLRLFLWRSTGDMPQHVPYYPNAHGYYYFRPYNAIHILQQQEMTARIGLDPRNPYDNRFLERIYAEQGAGQGTEEVSYQTFEPTVTVAVPIQQWSR